MPYTVVLSNATRNQATATYRFRKIFIWDNRYVEGTFTNTTGASFDLTPGELLVRSATLVGGFEIATANNLANVIGIAALEGGPVTLAANGTLFINAGVAGGIDGTELILPDGVTLDTIVSGKSLEDTLNSLGLHIDRSGVEQTRVEN